MSVSVFASGRSQPEPSVLLNNVVSKLDREAAVDAEGSALFAALIEKEYGTREDELKLGSGQQLGWGDMAALAYIQYSTGKSFAEMIKEGARRDFWAYADNAGLNCGKMAQLLGDFLKRAERERNTRIFDRLRASRRVHPMPDLGNGFGLFQESLDFRHIDVPQPTKIHDVPGDLAKGGQ
ncbi:MAG TPA: hypothetical protein VGK48_25515 [Terriglobia bacterium]|jgi:hypothetical protein